MFDNVDSASLMASDIKIQRKRASLAAKGHDI